MNERYAQQNQANTFAEKAPEHVTASEQWASAKSRLQQAQLRHGEAMAELEAARKFEQETWNRLENAAERGCPQPAPSALGSYSR